MLRGVICGHIHAAAMRPVGGILYVNCGDWVDSCTAVVEHHDGRMERVHWGMKSPTAMAAPSGVGAAPAAEPTTTKPAPAH
ncbi:MAG: hypothetical protein ACM36B_05605 [Bacteroidota bacterium]